MYQTIYIWMNINESMKRWTGVRYVVTSVALLFVKLVFPQTATSQLKPFKILQQQTSYVAT